MKDKHSKYFNLVKRWYDTGMWDHTAVENAIGKWITEEEFGEIVNRNPDGIES